jgi:hypothetical protein
LEATLGFKISWIAFRGLTKPDLLQIISGTDTGIVDEANAAPFSLAEIATGWSILFANDFYFLSEQRLEFYSANCALVACQVHEGIMVSAACAYENGKEQWLINHEAELGIRNLDVYGSPPPDFATIRDRLTKQQEEDDGDGLPVDYFFDIPVETATSLCGYRHDRWKFDWGKPNFTALDLPAQSVA